MVSYAPAQQLDEFAQETQPTTLSGIKQWIRDRISRYNRSHSGVALDPDDLKGKIYTAESLKWRDNNQIKQRGNAPNYFEGVWSLATCKHHMRQAGTVRSYFSEREDEVYLPENPFFVYTIAEKADRDNGRNAVASIAMVTHGFESVEAYGRFLQDHCSEEAFTSRRTRPDDSEVAEDIERRAREVGDCHVNSDCEAGPPTTDHQHRSSKGENCHCGEPRCSDECPCDDDCRTTENDQPIYERDLETDHLKLLSMPGYWTTWDEPAFVATSSSGGRMGQRGHGENIHSFAEVGQYLYETKT